VMTPFLVDGWANTLGLWDTPSWLRALTGLGYGVVLPLLLVPLASAQPLDPAAKPAMSHTGALLLPFGVGTLLLYALDQHASLEVFNAMAGLALITLVIFVVNFALTFCRHNHARRWSVT